MCRLKVLVLVGGLFPSVFLLIGAFGARRASAQSQASNGQIAGAVLDSSGGMIPGATVKITNKQLGFEQTTKTNAEGLFRFVVLPTGTYTVSAEKEGFSPAIIENVVVNVGQTRDVSLTLAVGTIKQGITVTASGIAISKTQHQPDAVINQMAINTLPINGRRFQDFVTLTPTAQVEPQRQQLSLAGQRGINGNINVDGVDYNQPFFGGIRGGERSNNVFTIPQESIKEFEVVQSGYSAEFGRSTGGIVNAITKSGTNNGHGSGFYLLRDREFARNNVFFGQLQTFLNRPIHPAPTQQQWGGSAGAPLKKDKMFIFGAYEQQRIRVQRQVLFGNLVGFTPKANEMEAFNFYQGLQTPYSQTDNGWTYLVRYDYNVSERHRFNIRYNQNSANALNATTAGTSVNPTVSSALSNNGTEQDRNYTLVGQLTSLLTPSVVNELRAEYSREVRPRLANAQQPTVSSSAGNFGTVSFLPTTELDWRTQFADSITWIHGNHSFKFGEDYNHLYADQTFGFNQFGQFSFKTSNIDTILTALSANPSAGQNRFDLPFVSLQYTRQIGNLFVALAANQLAFFAQDTWRIRPNFTVNYGLRWEGQFNPTPIANNSTILNQVRGFTFPSGDTIDPTNLSNSPAEFAPRIGFAWDPTNNNKTAIRGFGGIYYAQTPLLLMTNPMGDFRNPPANVSLTLPFRVPASNPNKTLYQQFKLIGVDLNTTPLGSLPVLTSDQVTSVAAALGLPGVNPFTGAAVLPLASDFRNPKSYQAGIGVQREVKSGLIVGADFNYVHTVHLQRDRDLNLPVPTVRPTDPAQRPFFGIAGAGAVPRPVPGLSNIWVRQSSAKALYRSLTLRAEYRRKRAEFGMFYNLSENLSDDDNERDATGVNADNPFNLRPEYHFSRIDRRGQFVGYWLINLPYGIDVSSSMRVLSGFPIDGLMGFDANGDSSSFNDRPYSAPGVSIKRNTFRNLGTRNVNLRVQKGFKLGESRRLIFSAEFFNVFNATNIQLSGSTVQNYCSFPVPISCGLSGPTNLNFLQVLDHNPTSARQGKFLLNNDAGAPFEAQLGVRFQF